MASKRTSNKNILNKSMRELGLSNIPTIKKFVFNDELKNKFERETAKIISKMDGDIIDKYLLQKIEVKKINDVLKSLIKKDFLEAESDIDKIENYKEVVYRYSDDEFRIQFQSETMGVVVIYFDNIDYISISEQLLDFYVWHN